MCGINGIIDIHQKLGKNQLHDIIHSMNKKIVYRGPDAEGIFSDDHLSMGMRRLSIIDLSTGNQPIYNEDQNLSIVFNGEIYNFQTLKKILKKNHKFSTNTDTEVILHAYEEWGVKAFDKIDGMFAFSIYDKREKNIIIVRDRIGEKPLYYYKDSDFFIWGSELKSLLCTDLISKQINKRGLNQYLQFTYIPAPLTIYDNIYKLLPGHWMKICLDGSITEGEYWNLDSIRTDKTLSYEEACKKLYKLMKKSIEERVVSDVPLGAFLSGGIDSSTVVGMMSKVMKVPVETFTIGYKEKEYDERSRARQMAEKWNTNHHECTLDYNNVLNSINEILMYLDEPLADPSILPSWFVCNFAKRYVKVALAGDAGDELFLGYDKYLINYYSDKFNKLPQLIRKTVKKIVFCIPDKSGLSRKVRKVINNAEKDQYEKRLDLMSRAFKKEERKYLMKSQFYDEECTSIVSDRYYKLKGESELKRTQYTDISLVLEGDMIAKMDRMSMLNSLEVRIPLLSKEIVELAFSLPDKYKLDRRNKKRILKDTFHSLLPDKFEKLPKIGFGIPIDRWFRNELRGMVEELLNKENIEKQQLFNWDYVNQILEEHYAGKKNNGDKIWTLIVFQKWYYTYFVNMND